MLNWIKKETQSLYIARPDQASNELIWAHPDRSIPRGAKITVRSDEVALFFREGQFIGEIRAGTVLMDTANVPFLGHLLIDQFTGGNQFITELYFCKLSETQISIYQSSLGQFTDILSTNLVSLEGGLEYTVRIKDPVKLITEVGGQNINTSDSVIDKLSGRLNNFLRGIVGNYSKTNQITDITSGSLTESISRELFTRLTDELSRMGVELIRILNLAISLDAQSEKILRDFGKRRSDLRIQEMGAQLAMQEGFAEFNLIQGQRQALEGLGQGLATGNSPILMGGLGMGANLTSPPRTRLAADPSGARVQRGSIIRSEKKYFCCNDGREEGPYTSRNIALLALTKNISLQELLIRGEDDTPDSSYPAEYEPDIRNEYNRRKPV